MRLVVSFLALSKFPGDHLNIKPSLMQLRVYICCSKVLGDNQKSRNNPELRKENLFIKIKRAMACVIVIIASSSNPRQSHEPVGHRHQRSDNRPLSGPLI